MLKYRPMVAFVIAAIAISFAAVATPAAAFDKAELKCRKGISKGMLKAITTADKTSVGCHKNQHKGKVLPAVDCNDLGPTPASQGEADPKGKFAKAQQKLIDTPGKKCVGLDGDVLAQFVGCPEPCNTDVGLAGILTDLDQVASCLACMAGDIVSTKNATLLGAPDPPPTGDDAKCAQAIGKGYSKYLSTILKSRTKCQDGIEKDGGEGLDANCQDSNDPDGKGKIAKALSKAEGGIDKACGAANLANVGSCSAVDIAGLKTCAQADSDAADMVGFPAHYQLDATVCPIGVVSTILSGNGSGGSMTNSFLDVGWTGEGHNFDIPGEYTFEADVSCPNSAPPCGVCTVGGVTATGANYERYLRCTNDFAIRCDEPFQIDLDDCGGSPCAYVLGPPLPLLAGNNPTCSVNALQEDITGTSVIESGDAELNLKLATKVFLPGEVLRPCPVCVGDTTPNDDVQDGVCEGNSTRAGLACDTNGFDETFASASNGEGLSLDCSPPIDVNISGTGLKIDLPLTTASHSLGANNTCDAPVAFADCFCGMCSGDTSVACRDDAECGAIGAGTCTAIGGNGGARKPNACSSFPNCVDIGNEKGECSDADKTYCDGITRANGFGMIGCLNNAECDITCTPLGGCGTCTDVEPLPCFLDPIEGTGVADPNNPTLVGSFCLGPTTSLSINGTTGSPGPGRVAISQDNTFVY